MTFGHALHGQQTVKAIDHCFDMKRPFDQNLVLRAPPKVIWLRVGNQSAMKILALLRRHADLIAAFEQEEDAECLELY